ncbi:MAG: Hpt domain-containing protein, partial [Desulfobacterales bacterium]|nr:Hpt domain-containing protein [Desulfobacterales bacterium]
MEYDSFMNLIDGMASDFLFLDGREIDVPAAGNFLNKLERLIKEADGRKVFQLKSVAGGLGLLLEKTLLDDIDDKETGFNILEKGITLMQEIGDSFKNTGGYGGDIDTFMESIVALTGEQRAESREQGATSNEVITGDRVLEELAEASQEKPQQSETVDKVQDDSLLRDFIVEGLEYIDEIEVNLLNLEQDPENPDYVNAIFRPFHSIKGVAGFLNLETIRDLAHALENLLDRVRNNELSVSSRLIDVILDGADALKVIIVKLKDDLEGNPSKPLEIDLSALKKRIESVEQDDPDAVEVKKLGEILVEDGAITKDALGQGLEAAQQSIPPKKIGEALISEGKVTPKQVSQALRKQTEHAADTAVIRVNIKKLDDLIDTVGELVITQSMIRQNASVLSNSDRKLSRDVSHLSSITS